MSPGELVLRDVTEDDLPVFFEHQREPEANRMAAFAARDREAFFAHWTDKVLGDEAVDKQTIVLDGEVVGNVVCFEQNGQPLVGYWIGRDYWGRGVATRALTRFLGQVEARPLYAHVAKTNPASIRVLEKCGFTHSGELSGGDGVDEVILELSGDAA